MRPSRTLLLSEPTLSNGSTATARSTDRFAADDEFAFLNQMGYLRIKRSVDVILASLLLLLTAPLIATIAGLIQITSRGPAFYVQTRLGRWGQPFRIYKLRTMTHDCEKTSGARWAMRNDPRVTPIGRILRLTHLDELPQLWNVLKGDMSMVGPRPERPEFIPLLEQAIPHYHKRMLVRPGVTGLAQTYLPPDTGIPSVRKKLLYDLRYLHTMSLLLDLRLMLATGLQAVGVPCRLVRCLLFLPRERTIERTEPEGSVLSLAGTVAPVNPVLAGIGPNGQVADLSYDSQPETTA